MTEQPLDGQGIVRNHNGLPAYCVFVQRDCLKPYCLRCSSYQEPKYFQRPKYDADAELFKYLLEHPDLLKIIGSATKAWFQKYKKNSEKKLRNCDVEMI